MSHEDAATKGPGCGLPGGLHRPGRGRGLAPRGRPHVLGHRQGPPAAARPERTTAGLGGGKPAPGGRLRRRAGRPPGHRTLEPLRDRPRQHRRTGPRPVPADGPGQRRAHARHLPHEHRRKEHLGGHGHGGGQALPHAGGRERPGDTGQRPRALGRGLRGPRRAGLQRIHSHRVLPAHGGRNSPGRLAVATGGALHGRAGPGRLCLRARLPGEKGARGYEHCAAGLDRQLGLRFRPLRAGPLVLRAGLRFRRRGRL